MDSFIARQPIFDIDMQVYGYELLYRSSAVKNSFDFECDLDHASAKVIMDSFQNIGLERMTGGKKAFVNFTANLLEHDAATLFPNQTLVVEVLERVTPTPQIMDCLRKLRGMGYKIALDDYEYAEDTRELLDIADIVKVDFIALDTERIKNTIYRVDRRRTALLAEKIEDHRNFELAKSLGFTLFQGYFFAMPVIVATRSIDPLKLNYLRLVRQVWQEGFLDYTRLSGTIRQDIALSYKMLRLVNSVYYAQRREVKDIQHALVMLGDNEVRKWVTLIAMAGYNRDRPDELMRASLICARFMELYAVSRRLPQADTEVMFLTGLFSLIDAILQQPMEELLSELSLPSGVESALLRGEGDAAVLLNFYRFCEKDDWDAVSELYAVLPQPGPDLQKLYLESIDWCNSIVTA